jgi:hypothetical protein
MVASRRNKEDKSFRMHQKYHKVRTYRITGYWTWNIVALVFVTGGFSEFAQDHNRAVFLLASNRAGNLPAKALMFFQGIYQRRRHGPSLADGSCNPDHEGSSKARCHIPILKFATALDRPFKQVEFWTKSVVWCHHNPSSP